jgi:hypothetical protein
MKAGTQRTTLPALPRMACSALLLTWGNLQEAANWCGAADLYDTRYLLLIPTPSGEQMARLGDTILKHEDGIFSVQNH